MLGGQALSASAISFSRFIIAGCELAPAGASWARADAPADNSSASATKLAANLVDLQPDHALNFIIVPPERPPRLAGSSLAERCSALQVNGIPLRWRSPWHQSHGLAIPGYLRSRGAGADNYFFADTGEHISPQARSGP